MPRAGWETAAVGRRAVLAAGAAVLAAGLGATVAGCTSDALPGADPGPRVSGSFVSRRRQGARTGWSVAYPPGTATDAALPVLIVLHGRGASHRTAFDSLHLDRFLAAAVHGGTPRFAVASVDGGDHSYWHPRRDGDAAGMVTDEFVPLLHGRGLAVGRIGLLGWSMGAYGALYIAGTLGAARVAAVAAESPAIWAAAGESAAGAFDDADDFDRHAVLGRESRLTGIPLRVDCGDADGFAPITRVLRARLHPTPAGGIEPGGHDADYWRSQAPAQLAFAGRHLAAG